MLRNPDSVPAQCSDRLVGVWLCAWLVCASAPGVAYAGKPCPGEHCVTVRPQDEVLLIDTRSLCCRTDEAEFAQGITGERFELAGDQGERQWRVTPILDLLAGVQPDRPTVVFAHGNRVARCDVKSRGLWVYDRLIKRCGDGRPVRFVIFSWPSARIEGMIRDAREKAARTKPAGLHMAWAIHHMPADSRLGLLGYSYGARVISGATHLLAGGSLGQLALSDGCRQPKRKIRAAYLAAAFDANWLGRGGYHGQSLRQVDSLLVATNQLDPAMKFYRLISPRHEHALGYRGPSSLRREDQYRVRLMNVTAAVGKTHDMCEYMMRSGFMANARRRLTFEDAQVMEVASAEAAIDAR